jgi:hypothetical protein
MIIDHFYISRIIRIDRFATETSEQKILRSIIFKASDRSRIYFVFDLGVELLLNL